MEMEVLKGEGGLWREVVVSRYKNNEGELSFSLSERVLERGASHWRKGICMLGRFESLEDWFQEGVRRKLGRGNTVKFWEDVWVGNISLNEVFPRLYNMSEDREMMIQMLGEWQGVNWVLMIINL